MAKTINTEIIIDSLPDVRLYVYYIIKNSLKKIVKRNGRKVVNEYLLLFVSCKLVKLFEQKGLSLAPKGK
jgi:hypothetical protein